MPKKVLVIECSLRKNSNTDDLAESFAKGAAEAGNEVEIVSLKGKKIGFCNGCLACQQTGKCNIKDDANAIVSEIKDADVVVWATPVYYYCVSGQMKTLIDRTNPLYGQDIRVHDVYLILAAEDSDSTHAVAGAMKALIGWIECMPGTKLIKTICATSTSEAGAAMESSAYQQCYLEGKTVGGGPSDQLTE
ncbi:MAG: flavodoxin family protein [Methanomethylophilus sp.]|jgi:multimeric flavodoxin WrbA